MGTVQCDDKKLVSGLCSYILPPLGVYWAVRFFPSSQATRNTHHPSFLPSPRPACPPVWLWTGAPHLRTPHDLWVHPWCDLRVLHHCRSMKGRDEREKERGKERDKNRGRGFCTKALSLPSQHRGRAILDESSLARSEVCCRCQSSLYRVEQGVDLVDIKRGAKGAGRPHEAWLYGTVEESREGRSAVDYCGP